MNNKELFLALNLLEKEKGIPADYMIAQIKKAIVIACKNTYGGNENVEISLDSEKNQFNVYLLKTVAEEVSNPNFEISPADAKQYDKKAQIGGQVKIPLDPKEFGRIAVQTSRSVIRQGIRDSEKGQMLHEFQSKTGEIVTASVERIDSKTGVLTVKVGKAETLLMPSEQVGLENIKEGDYIKIYVVGVRETEKGSRAVVSRTHPDFIKRMFENQVPEIYDGTVEIKAISREAGARTKMAVYSRKPEVDAVGSCIGSKGARVAAIVNELGGEKIDIIEYSEDAAKFIAAALAPATVLSVSIKDEEAKKCRATVPDAQLSLAIGNKGQNARLAAKLTGWKIDIRPESGFYGEEDEDEDDDKQPLDNSDVQNAAAAEEQQ